MFINSCIFPLSKLESVFSIDNKVLQLVFTGGIILSANLAELVFIIFHCFLHLLLVKNNLQQNTIILELLKLPDPILQIQFYGCILVLFN